MFLGLSWIMRSQPHNEGIKRRKRKIWVENSFCRGIRRKMDTMSELRTEGSWPPAQWRQSSPSAKKWVTPPHRGLCSSCRHSFQEMMMRDTAAFSTISSKFYKMKLQAFIKWIYRRSQFTDSYLIPSWGTTTHPALSSTLKCCIIRFQVFSEARLIDSFLSIRVQSTRQWCKRHNEKSHVSMFYRYHRISSSNYYNPLVGETPSISPDEKNRSPSLTCLSSPPPHPSHTPSPHP